MTRQNTLTTAETFRLADWIRAHLEQLRENQPLTASVAAAAAEALGFPITGNNVRSVATAANLQWEPERRRAAGPVDHSALFAKAILAIADGRPLNGLRRQLAELAPADTPAAPSLFDHTAADDAE